MSSPTSTHPNLRDELPSLVDNISLYVAHEGSEGIFETGKEQGGSFIAPMSVGEYEVSTLFILDYEHYKVVTEQIGKKLARPAAVQNYMHTASGGGEGNYIHTTTTDTALHDARKAAILKSLHSLTPVLLESLDRNAKAFAQQVKIGDKYTFDEVFGNLMAAKAMAAMIVGDEDQAEVFAEAIAAGMESAGYVVLQRPTPEHLLAKIKVGQDLVKQLIQDHVDGVKLIPENCFLGQLVRGVGDLAIIPEADWWLECWLAFFAGLDNLRGTASNTAIKVIRDRDLHTAVLEATRRTRLMTFAQAMQDEVLRRLLMFLKSSAWQTVPVNLVEGEALQLPNVTQPITSPYIQFFTSLPAVQMYEDYIAEKEGREPRAVDPFFAGYATCTGKEAARVIVMLSIMNIIYELGEVGKEMRFVGQLPRPKYGVVQVYPWALEFEIVAK